MTYEDKARAYDELLDKAKQIYNKENDVLIKHIIESLFPELRESDDERMRKNLIGYIKGISKNEVCEETKDSWIAWLEKQGEHANFRNKIQIGDKVTRNEDGVLVNLSQMNRAVEEYNIRRIGSKHAEGKLAEKIKELNDMLEKQGEQKPDKVDSKFHEGDWVVSPNGVYWHIDAIQNGRYEVTADTGQCGNWPLDTNIYRLWTIQDAKDGEVLYECNEKKPFIFKELETKHIGDIASYCDIFDGIFNPNEDDWTTLDVVPATKEQRDTLMKAMADAGYTFDFEKKELKKIEQKPADKIEPKFHEGDWVVYDGWTTQIKEVYEDGYSNIHQGFIPKKREEEMRLWTVQDAKAGDVLANDHHILILRELGYSWAANGNPDSLYAYCGIKPNGNFELEQKGYCFCGTLHTHPATKEQCDTLMKAMADAGYTFDFEKKELKKIEQKPAEWSKQQVVNALTSMLTEKLKPFTKKLSDGTISDREEMFMSALVEIRSFVNSPSFQIGKDISKEWSEEDERKLESIVDSVRFLSYTHPERKPVYDGDIEWLNGIKDRIYLQPRQEWTEEDSDAIEQAIIALEDMFDKDHPLSCYSGYKLPFDKAAERLKSIKNRIFPQTEEG